VADLVLQALGRQPVGGFLGTSNTRVLEAVVVQMRAHHATHDRCSIIAPLERGQSITAAVRRQASNRLAAIPEFRGDEIAAIQRIAYETFGEPTGLSEPRSFTRSFVGFVCSIGDRPCGCGGVARNRRIPNSMRRLISSSDTSGSRSGSASGSGLRFDFAMPSRNRILAPACRDGYQSSGACLTARTMAVSPVCGLPGTVATRPGTRPRKPH
jgi:hypothetical protein